MPSEDDLAHLRELVFDTSDDRAAVLVAGAMVDNLLAYCLLMTFRFGVNPDVVENLLYGDSGALNNMSAKVKVLYALGIIDDDLRRELELLREIRNIFAHTSHRISFSDATIAAKIAHLQIALSDEKSGPMASGGGKFAFLASTNVCMRTLMETANRVVMDKAEHLEKGR
jgi:hypothetical protein